MNRLGVRLTVSHLAVALIGGAATFVVVTLLAPALFDQQMHMGTGMGGNGMGAGNGPALRASFASAVMTALTVGTVVGALVAAVLGVVAARRAVVPINRVGVAVGEIARGNYAHRVAAPSEVELASLVTDVNALGDQLAATEARRLRLLGEVAHELRTPLTVIEGYVEGMIDGVLPREDAQLTQIASEARRLRRLGDDLSALSRAEEGRERFLLADVDLDALAAGVVARFQPQASDAGIDLRVAPGAGRARADADRTVQVLTNLIGNALRATPPGGRVHVTGARTHAGASIIVEDTGVGLAPEDFERVFERFYRVGGRPASDGSGIGLTIARSYMRAMGGTLNAASDGVGRGARFTAIFAPTSANADQG